MPSHILLCIIFLILLFQYASMIGCWIVRWAGASARAMPWRGGYAKIIRAIRQIQGRPNDFDSYYQNLFETYTRLPACKDELRMAIEGPGYKQKHKREKR